MKIQSAKYFVVAMTVAGALCVAAMLVFVTIPTLREVKGLSKQMTEAQTEVEAQYANRKQLSDTIEHVKAAHDVVMDLSKQFVPVGEELTFIKAVEAIGDKNDIAASLRLSNGGGVADAKEFDRGFSLSLDGPFRAVMHALVDIERMTQLTIIQTVDVRSTGTPGEDAPVSVNISGLFAAPPKSL